MAQLLKNPPAMQGTPVPFLVREDPLEKEMATHSSILAWETPWIESVVGYSLLLLSRFRIYSHAWNNLL